MQSHLVFLAFSGPGNVLGENVIVAESWAFGAARSRFESWLLRSLASSVKLGKGLKCFEPQFPPILRKLLLNFQL